MPLVSNFPVGYLPNAVNDFEGVNRELLKIQNALQEPAPLALALTQWNAAPSKPYSGMTVYADGTNWNPGGTGEGVYTYYGAAWHKLG